MYNGAMLHLAFWIFILVLGLSYLGISIQEIINSPAGQANIAYVYNLLLQLWHWALPYIQSFLGTINKN